MSETTCVELSHHQHYRHSLGQNSPYYAALSARTLLGTRCPTCLRVFVPPRLACLVDRSPTRWVEVGDAGTLIAITEMARRPSYAAAGPESLAIGLVQLDGASNAVLAEVDVAHPVDAGQRVTAVFRSWTSHPAQQLSFAVLEPADSAPAGGA